MRFFKQPSLAPCAQNTDTALIREKLASAEAEITEASAALDRLALRAVLAGDQSAKTTGHVIPVDGGLSEAFLR